MSDTAAPSLMHRYRLNWTGSITVCAIAAFFAAVAWFLGADVFAARTHKPAAYALHIAGGVLVLATAPFQFVAAIRNRYRRIHRTLGYVFVAGSVAAIAGYALILPTEIDIFLISQVTALALWAGSVAQAVVAIRRKHLLTHQHNMARAFVIATYFVTVRIVDQHLMWALEPFSSVEAARLAHSDWLSWVLPVVVVEIWFGLRWQRSVYRRSLSTETKSPDR